MININYLFKSNFFLFLRHLILIPALFLSFTWGGTTGKISGRIIDQTTGESLIGCNIIVIEEGLGAATDLNGYYNILNIPPGTYTVKCMMIGYTIYERYCQCRFHYHHGFSTLYCRYCR